MAQLILKLDANKATGPNNILTNILQKYNRILSKPLSKIINISFQSGIFPDYLKIAKVVPVLKKGDKLLCTNYKPISLLSNISKIFEKAMYIRVTSFLIKENILYDLQFGFRSNNSTNHALMSITEMIRNAIDQGKQSCGVFIDL